MIKKPGNKFLFYIMTEDPWAKIFWHVYFWHGMRQARKQGIAARLLPGNKLNTK